MGYQYRVSCPQTGWRGTIYDTVSDALAVLDIIGRSDACQHKDCHRIIRSDSRHWLSQEERNQ